MGMKCCVRKCKSGYDSESPGKTKVSFHSFPSDSDLRDKWTKNIANTNWEPKPTSRVCSLHFEENDFQVVSKDKKDRRKKSRFGNEEQLKKKSLFPNAVPRIFFNPSRHIRKLESEIISEATIDYPEQELPIEMNVKIEHSFSNNPWCVDDATAFLKFCCPECDYQIPDLQMFSDHAVDNHLKSTALFGTEKAEEHVIIKQEHLEYEYENNLDYNDVDMQTDDLPSYPQYGENDYLNDIDPLFKSENVSIKEENSSFTELRANEELKSPILCSFCDLACYSIGDILQHHSEHHGSETPPYFQCNNCDLCHKKKFFVEKHSMKTHGKHFMCRKCKKILGKTETYEEHLIKSELCKITFEKLGPEDSACEICNFRCTSSAELKNHKKEHRDGKKMLCFYCDYKIDDWVRLRSHIERKHPEHGEKKHFCEECGKGFLFDHMMRDHKRKAHPKNDQEHVCHICGFTTMSKLHIKRHILVKHQSDKHKKCPHCDFHTAYTHGIQTHIDGNHPELYEKNFDCDHCSKRFIFTQSVRKHLDKLQVRKQLACKYCGLQVLKIKELLDHVAEIHPETRQNLPTAEPNLADLQGLPVLSKKMKEPAICEVCNVEVECTETLKKHKLQEHTEGKMKCCFYCEYKSPTYDNLRSHIEVNHPEHGEKKHLCDLCGKGFIFPSSVNRHKVLNHQKKTCHICGKECFNKSSLKDHMSSAHKFEEMTLMCQFCTFSTSSKGNLKSHIAAKHKLDNHKKCPYCEYHTHALHRIQIHIDSKHPEHDKKHFSCDHCSRRFIYENSLKNHLENIRNGPKSLAKKKLKRNNYLQGIATKM